MSAMAPLAAAYQARGMLAADPRAVGVIGLDPPLEVIRAAGLIPLRITAEPTSTGAAAFAEGAGHPLLRGYVAALTEGPYRALRRLVIGTTPSNLAALTAFLRQAQTMGEALADLDIHQFDFNRGPSPFLAETRRAAVEGLIAAVKRWGEGSVDLASAIAETNRVRATLAEVQALRAGGAPRLSGLEALTAFGAADTVVRARLSDLVAERSQGPALKGLRTLYSGSPTPSLAAYQRLEASGLVIVADDQDCGSRSLGAMVAESGDPIDALIAAALASPPAAARSTIAQRTAYLIELARRTQAEQVLFEIEPFDHPPAWEVPTLTKALAAAGVGVLEPADV